MNSHGHNGPGTLRQGPIRRSAPNPGVWRRLVVLFVLTALAIVAAGYLIFLKERRDITEDAFHLVEGIHRQAQRQIASWRNDREMALEALTRNPAYQRLLQRDLARAEFDGPEWQPLMDDLRELLGPGYLSAVVFDRSGRVRLRLGAPLQGEEVFAALAQRALAEKRILYGDTTAAFADHRNMRVFNIGPVVVEGVAVAAIGFQLDPHYYLDSIVPVWPEADSSGEVLLVHQRGKTVYFLSRPKYWSGPRLMIRPATPDLVAAQTGNRVRGRDYRAVETLATVGPVPGTPWRLVAKVDETEVYAAIRQVASWITLVSLAFVAATGGLIFTWWRKERADNLVAVYEEQLHRRALESHYDYLARYANDPIMLADEQGHIIEWNERALEFYGYDAEEMAGLTLDDLSAADWRRGRTRSLALEREQSLSYETVHRTKDEREIPVEVSTRIIRVDDRIFQQATIRDITEHKRADERIRRLNDLYAALSQINAAIVRNRSREALFPDICRIAVDHAHFDSAWVGLLDREKQRLEPVAQYGRASHAELLRRGRANPALLMELDPIATALREGQIAIADELGETHYAAAPVLRDAGVRAVAGLPLMLGGQTIGVIGISSSQPNVFDAEVARLLGEMADDVSFALETFERDARRVRAERATRESEARYRHLFDHMTSGVLVLEAVGEGEDFLIRDANHAVETIEGVRRDQVVDRRLGELVPAVTQSAPFAALRNVWRTRTVAHVAPRAMSDLGLSGWRETWLYPMPSGEVVAVYDDVSEREEALQAMRRSEERLALVLKGVNDGYWDIDFRSGEVYYSRRYAEMLGYDLSELDRRVDRFQEEIHPEDLPASRKSMEDHLAGRTARYQSEHRQRRKDGSYIWVRARGSVVARGESGEPLRMTGTHSDITEQKRYEEQLRLWATVFGGSGEAIFITDASRRIISANQSFTRITGYEESEVIGKDPSILSSGEHDRAFYQNLWAALNSTGHWQGEIRDRRKNGEVFPMWTAITAVHDHQHRLRNYIAISSDISERKAAEERIRFLAQHDALTSLPNRVLLQDRLSQAIVHAQRTSTRAAVLFVDIDRFKNVNDSLGHHLGDELLKAVAERLKGCVRMDDTVSRQGGDEFLLVLTELHEISDAAHVAQKVIDSTDTPFMLDGSEVNITLSIGIAIYPEDGSDSDTLIRNADAAMYYAKERGRNNYQFFIAELNQRALTRITLENSLRRAVDRGDFVLHYQPKVNIWTNELVGMEALVRWKKEGGLVAPANFIAVAEETGLILPIGEWVLIEACRQQGEWTRQGFPEMPVAVNISATQFRQKNMLSTLRELISRSCVRPAWLEVELTESVIMEDAEASVATLHGLKEMGISLAIDDFGTGYSSLSYLRRFPMDRLKVDQSFVRDLQVDPADLAITETIIALAKILGLKVIAEGVEHQREIELLRERHCDELQGFIFSPPLPPGEFTAWWRRHIRARGE